MARYWGCSLPYGLAFRVAVHEHPHYTEPLIAIYEQLRLKIRCE